MAETLAQSLGTVPQGVPGVRDRASLLFSNEDIGKRGSQARALQPTLLKERATAETELETLKGQQQREQSEAEVRALEEDVRKQRAENVRVRGLEQPYKEFEAPKYTAADYAKGAAMRALTAVMLGGVAKTSALTQLKAIKAMQDAEKEGRQNDFLNAQLEFDQAEKKRVDFNERLKRDVEEFRDLLQKDTKLALAKAKIINSQLSGGIAAKTADVRSFADYAKLLDEMAKTGDDLKIRTELEDIKGRYKLAEERIRAGAKGAPATGGGMGTPGYSEQIRLHPSGVPLAPVNMYEGLDPKETANTRRQEFDLAKKIRQEIAANTDKQRKIKSDMDVAEQALKNIEKKGGQPTGGVYGLPVIGGVAQSIRTSQDPDAARFRTVAANMQRNAYVPGEGQISNFERELFAQANLDLGRPMKTNYDLIEANRVAADRAIERAKFYDRYFAVNRSMSGADELWDQYLNANPILMQNEQGEIVSNPNRAKSYEEYFRSVAGGGRQMQEPSSAREETRDDMELTADDVVEQAELNGISIDEAGRRLRAKGYTIRE
jgi:hypothetical protein